MQERASAIPASFAPIGRARYSAFFDGHSKWARREWLEGHPEIFHQDSTLPPLHLYLSRAYLALGRIEERNPSLNAVIQVYAEEARARGRDATQDLMRGEDWGPLHGVPTLIKDGFGQKPGTQHFRIVFLPDEATLTKSYAGVAEFIRERYGN